MEAIKDFFGSLMLRELWAAALGAAYLLLVIGRMIYVAFS